MSKCNKMDSRCPRKLSDHPDKWCPLAVQRLKALRLAGKELEEKEEMKLPGCNWAISSQMHNYCFFSFIKDLPGKPLLDIEIAHLLNIDVDSVKQIEKEAISVVREEEFIEELKEICDGESIVDNDKVRPDMYDNSY